MPLDAARLRVLVEVAHAGSIVAAAKAMSFTPSALSQQLTKLEREVGCPLVERGPAGVTLTQAGTALVAHGEIVLGELRAAEQTVRALLGRSPAQLSIGEFATAGQTLVPAALASFRREHPTVRLSLLDLEPPAGYGLVASGDLDLLITHRYPGVVLPETVLCRQSLLSDPLRLVLPPDHPAGRASRVRLADLVDEDWVCGETGSPDCVALRTVAGRPGFPRRVAYETKDYLVSLSLVAAGLGVALVPWSMLRGQDRSRFLVRGIAGARPAREIYLVHRQRPAPLVLDMVAALTRSATVMVD
ncbi:MAG TPA: LysR family transcriptional regulator [Pseudonocardiaceae bacterium]|jgi:DNA-binding transcriptional LysR family regulator|nr:LysR family transcriptional regulator [Pseudonocardiaceae bacterium]